MKNTLFMLITLIGLPAAAQNSGFFGKTSFVEVTGVGNYNALNNWLYHDPYYTRSGNALHEAKDRFNGGVYIAAGTAVKRNVALTLEAGWWFFNIAGPDYISYEESSGYTNSTYIRHENIDARTFSIMPIVEIGGKKGLLPIGISHQIGVGYTSSHLVEKDYVVTASSSDFGYQTQDFVDSMNVLQGGFADYKNKYKGATILYGLKVRTPLTKNILLNYGLRYTLNVAAKSGRDEYSNYYDSEDWTQDAIRRTRFRSVVSLNLGLTYVF